MTLKFCFRESCQPWTRHSKSTIQRP